MEDIVERLRREARNLSVRCECEYTLTATNKRSASIRTPKKRMECRNCKNKKLLWEAANEIEEMRSLDQARRKD